jgi:hypothetical protein
MTATHREPGTTRLSAIEARLRQVEDTLAIQQLVALYGPAADSVSPELLEDMWASDGVYAPGGTPKYVGKAEVGGVVHSPAHQAYVNAGSGHLLSSPVIRVDGDVAVAVNYSQVYVHHYGTWQADRLSANRWELQRTTDGWVVQKRESRLLDGDAAARALLVPKLTF